MIEILKLATIVVTLLVTSITASTVAPGECRSCEGYYEFRFENLVMEDQARDFLNKETRGCAIGGQYTIDRITPISCFRNGPCKSWRFHVVLDRYCGSTGYTSVGDRKTCSAGQLPYGCATTKIIRLQCGKKVACDGQCKCPTQPQLSALPTSSRV